MAAVHKGRRIKGDSAAKFLVREYVERHRLAQIGLTASLDNMSTFVTDAFVLISAHFDKLHEDDRKRREKEKPT